MTWAYVAGHWGVEGGSCPQIVGRRLGQSGSICFIVGQISWSTWLTSRACWEKVWQILSVPLIFSFPYAYAKWFLFILISHIQIPALEHIFFIHFANVLIPIGSCQIGHNKLFRGKRFTIPRSKNLVFNKGYFNF
jgi:hypothetical protein